ncbi:uncharacterized protein F5Z01DRAFT_629783, partial [Emericellopsis atlantica]
DEFLDAAREVYTSTIKSNRGLRDIIIKLIIGLINSATGSLSTLPSTRGGVRFVVIACLIVRISASAILVVRGVVGYIGFRGRIAANIPHTPLSGSPRSL